MNYKNAYEELKKIYEKLEDKYIHNVPCCNEEDCELYKKYKQSKDNWNKLKEWLEEGKKVSSEQDNRIGYNFTTLVLDKMQEIEGGMNE